jgi:hypothetical protein
VLIFQFYNFFSKAEIIPIEPARVMPGREMKPGSAIAAALHFDR